MIVSGGEGDSDGNEDNDGNVGSDCRETNGRLSTGGNKKGEGYSENATVGLVEIQAETADENYYQTQIEAKRHSGV